MILSEVSMFFSPVNRIFGSYSLLLLRVKDRGCCTLMVDMVFYATIIFSIYLDKYITYILTHNHAYTHLHSHNNW